MGGAIKVDLGRQLRENAFGMGWLQAQGLWSWTELEARSLLFPFLLVFCFFLLDMLSLEERPCYLWMCFPQAYAELPVWLLRGSGGQCRIKY